MRIRSPGAGAPRQAWVAYAQGLAAFAVAYNVLEGLVSMAFGWTDDSVALFGFGADSFIEVGSSMLILWRLKPDNTSCSETLLRRERRAASGIAALFLLLALGTAAGALFQLAERKHPDTTVPGLAVSVLSLAFMYWLWTGKARAARALDSRALQGDAAGSLACIKLSTVLFAGSLAFWLAPGLWWADAAAAALLLSAFIAKEGLELARAARKPGFEGTCDCH